MAFRSLSARPLFAISAYLYPTMHEWNSGKIAGMAFAIRPALAALTAVPAPLRAAALSGPACALVALAIRAVRAVALLCVPTVAVPVPVLRPMRRST